MSTIAVKKTTWQSSGDSDHVTHVTNHAVDRWHARPKTNVVQQTFYNTITIDKRYTLQASYVNIVKQLRIFGLTDVYCWRCDCEECKWAWFSELCPIYQSCRALTFAFILFTATYTWRDIPITALLYLVLRLTHDPLQICFMYVYVYVQ